MADRLDMDRIPRHVAIIMDGNGRWARERGLSRIRGHRAGVESIRTVVRYAGEIGIKYLTLYAFSIENWSRPKREVTALMRLLRMFLEKEVAELDRNDVRLRTIGRIAELPEEVREWIRIDEERTRNNGGLNLILALNYGGRSEIVDGIRKMADLFRQGKMRPEDIDEESFHDFLYASDVPDPDLLIRTSGEMRISNFLLWQISYAEMWVTQKYWPDFRERDLRKAIVDYQRRERRFGGVKASAS